MAKKKISAYEEIENNIIAELNQHTPGSPEYKAILENLTVFRHSMEETRTNQVKEKNESKRIEIDLKKIENETNDRAKERELTKEQNELNRELEERRMNLNLEAERFKAKHQFAGSLSAAAIGAGATVIGICIANSAAKKRTREVLYFEETGSIASNGGKNIINNILKPIKG